MDLKTAREKVAWALRFMVTDLDSLREGDRLNLRDDIVSFVGWSQEHFPIWEPSEINDFLTRENIGATQKETQEILEAIGRVNTAISPHKPASLGGKWEQPTQTVQAWGLVYSPA